MNNLIRHKIKIDTGRSCVVAQKEKIIVHKQMGKVRTISSNVCASGVRNPNL